MKYFKFSFYLFLNVLITLSCSKNNSLPSPSTDPSPVVNEFTVEEINEYLTDDSQSAVSGTKVWKVTSGEIKNPSGTVDISDLPNVKDDEFLFKKGNINGEIKLTWRPRNDLRLEGTSSDEVRTDYYRAPVEFTGYIDQENPHLVIFHEGHVVAKIISEDEILIEIGDEVELGKMVKGRKNTLWDGWSPSPGFCRICLIRYTASPKPESSYDPIPSELNFTKILDLPDAYDIVYGAPGFTSSLASNKLYWSYRLDGLEYVFSYDLSSGELETCSSDQNSFVSKQLHVLGDDLKVIGGLRINTYPLNLAPVNTNPSCNPESKSHELRLSRFGSAVMEGSIYIFGGDLNEINSNKIYKYDDSNNRLEEIGTLPSPKSWANGDIVDGKLYIFGGQAQFEGTPSENTIFIYDLDNGATETLQLPVPLFRSYASRNKNYIYVSGQLDESSDIFFGVFNTLDNSFTQIPVSLDDSGNKTIHQMTVLGKKIYVIYGGLDEDDNPVEFSIQVADL